MGVVISIQRENGTAVEHLLHLQEWWTDLYIFFILECEERRNVPWVLHVSKAILYKFYGFQEWG